LIFFKTKKEVENNNINGKKKYPLLKYIKKSPPAANKNGVKNNNKNINNKKIK